MDPLLMTLILQGAKLVLKEIQLGRLDGLPEGQRRALLDEARSLEAEWARLAPRDD